RNIDQQSITSIDRSPLKCVDRQSFKSIDRRLTVLVDTHIKSRYTEPKLTFNLNQFNLLVLGLGIHWIGFLFQTRQMSSYGWRPYDRQSASCSPSYTRFTKEWSVCLARESCREEERISIDAELLKSIDMDDRMRAEHIL
ncbi:hypothetical protein IGI04_030405, partial [Brassica rapa subsp. trilocularis]